MKIYRSVLLVFTISFGLFFFNGCATIVHGTTQVIPLSTEPSGAEIVIDGTERHRSPTKLILKRKFDHIIEISKEGFQKETVNIKSVLSGAVAGNILAGGFIGWGVDAVSGGQWRLVPETIDIRLRPIGSQKTIVKSVEKEPSLEEKLDQIKNLKNKGKITEDEYNKMRSAILSGAQSSKTISAPASSTPVKYQTQKERNVLQPKTKEEVMPIEQEKGVSKPESEPEKGDGK